MAYDQRAPRQMVQGSWTCSGCGATITELPFEPAADRLNALLCRDCHRQKRDSRPDNRPPRQMFQGNWTCSGCGAAITQLPFQPAPGREDTLKCRDCFRSSR